MVGSGAFQLAARGRVSIPFPQSHLVEPAVGAFMRFLDEDAAYRDEWMFHFPYDKDPDDGLLVRGKGDGHDNKHVFHYRPWLEVALISRGVDYRRHKELLDASHRLWAACSDVFASIILELHARYPDANFVQRAMRTPFSVLRLLVYDDLHGVVGKEHTDKCAVTLHVAESEPGLVLDGRPHVSVPGMMEAFGGDCLEKMTQGNVRALPHRVELAGERQNKRWAVIFFGHLDTTDGELVQF